MIYYPNAKINLGLRVLRSRPDGYHDIASVMVPVEWHDTLSVTPCAGAASSFSCSGTALDCAPEKNLVLKALRRLENHIGRTLAPMAVELVKTIPFGAGLGGGSSDAAFALAAFNELGGLNLSRPELASVAAGVGADCPFFIYNRPMLVTGIGDVLEPVDLSGLSGLTIVIAKRESTSVNTAQAYSMITPDDSVAPAEIVEALRLPIGDWRTSDVLQNDFEKPVFEANLQIGNLKQQMYDLGADFAAMSGSGAAVFGLFSDAKMAEQAYRALDNCEKHISTLQF